MTTEREPEWHWQEAVAEEQRFFYRPHRERTADGVLNHDLMLPKEAALVLNAQSSSLTIALATLEGIATGELSFWGGRPTRDNVRIAIEEIQKVASDALACIAKAQQGEVKG